MYKWHWDSVFTFSLYLFTENEYEMLGIVYVLSTWIKQNWFFAFEKKEEQLNVENVSIIVGFIQVFAWKF